MASSDDAAFSPEAPTSATLEMYLKVHKGGSAGQEFVARRYPVVIGRGQDCNVRLHDNADNPTLSRRHARIILEGGRLKLEDLSTNGTWLGSHQLSRGETPVLKAGEPVWLGFETLITVDFKPNASVLVPDSHPVAQAAPPRPVDSVPALPVVNKGRPTARAEARHSLTIQALGPLEVLVDGVAIADDAWSSRKSILLLVYLADHAPQSLAAESLLQDLWSEDKGTRQALQSACSRLRQALRGGRGDGRPDPLYFNYHRYEINEAYALTFDARQFETGCHEARRTWGAAPHSEAAVSLLSRAVSLYRGNFLESAAEDWFVRRRAHLQQLFAESLVALALLHEGRGDARQAQALYEELLRRDPGAESAYEGSIRCLCAMGRREEALRQFHRAVAELKRLLDLSPGPHLVELRDAVVRGEALPAPPPPFSGHMDR